MPFEPVKSGAIRTFILPLLLLMLLIGFLWYWDSGRAVPFLREENTAGTTGGQDDGFFSLESQGIKLGAAGGAAPKEGEVAPDFNLRDVNGKVVSLSDFRGQTIVLNFWATWCAPCRREFPEFVEAYERNKDKGLIIVGVNLRENAGSVRKFADQFGARFPVLLDIDGSVASQYRLIGLPVTWFIDSQGVVRSQVIGPVTPGLLRTNLAGAGFELTGER
jgi:peroxiredoxin